MNYWDNVAEITFLEGVGVTLKLNLYVTFTTKSVNHFHSVYKLLKVLWQMVKSKMKCSKGKRQHFIRFCTVC